MNTTYYSTNEENFDHETLEEAVEWLWDENEVGKTVTIWKGEAAPQFASNYLPNIADVLTEHAYDELPEYDDLWEFTNEQSKSLQDAIAKAVDQWATDNNTHPNFYSITNVEEIQVLLKPDEEFEIVQP